MLNAASIVEAFQTHGTVWLQPCWQDLATEASADASVPQCLNPPRGSGGEPSRALFLVGDSHAAMSVEGLRRAVQGEFSFHWAAIGHGCALDIEGGSYDGHRCDSPSCDCGHWASNVMNLLRQHLKPGDVVVYAISAEHYRRLTNQFMTSELVPLAANTGATIVLVGPTPVIAARATQCLPTRFATTALERCDVPRANAHAFGGPMNTAMQALADAHDRVYHFEVAEFYCEAMRCRATIPGTSTYWVFDDNHFTQAGSMYLWPWWCNFFHRHGWFR